MPKLLDSDDEGEVKTGGGDALKINESYATAYERWRRAEEYQKLKDKYGEDILSEDSVASDCGDDDSDESDESESDVNESVFDEQFLKVYGALKARDPLIYDDQVRFFDEKEQEDDSVNNDDESQVRSADKKKSKGMNLREYHRTLVEKEHGITEEDRLMESGGSIERPNKPSYVQEMENIKKEFKSILEDDEGDDDLIKGVKNVQMEKTVSPAEVLQKAAQNDERVGFLANYWQKKDLDNREKFLKDYILNKRYLDSADREDMSTFRSKQMIKSKPSSSEENATQPEEDFAFDEDNEEDNEVQISAKLEKLADRPSYHFQETDGEVIKRYPREIESVRNIKNLTVRNLKRSEIKERKTKEKQEALQRFRELRRAEAKAKLAKLMEISGNERLLADELPDIDTIVDDITNFDPDKYDQCMSKLFDEKFYDVSGQSDKIKKPTFEFIPGIDDVDDNLNPVDQEAAGHEVEGEDIDDGDDGASNSRRKKKKLTKKEKKKREKDPAEKKNIGIYEDVIAGEIPTRFKYREVPANDFGLTPEELLFADDKDLNQWVSLKKTCQYRPMEEETYDIKTYGRKAKNLNLKKKILKSFYEPKEESTDGNDNDFDEQGEQQEEQQGFQQHEELDNHPQSSQSHAKSGQQRPGKRKRLSNRKRPAKKATGLNINTERLRSYDLSNKAIKRLH